MNIEQTASTKEIFENFKQYMDLMINNLFSIREIEDSLEHIIDIALSCDNERLKFPLYFLWAYSEKTNAYYENDSRLEMYKHDGIMVLMLIRDDFIFNSFIIEKLVDYIFDNYDVDVKNYYGNLLRIHEVGVELGSLRKFIWHVHVRMVNST